MELHFYPGINTLVVKSGSLKTQYEAWGGPAAMGNDPYMAEEPTWPGVYIIHSTLAYRTPTWSASKLKWGTELSDKAKINDVWYKLPSGQWGSVAKDVGFSRLEIMDMYFVLYGKKMVPSKWVFNDFGPLAIRWFKDLNNNKLLDGKETLSGQMFHTTPQDEADTATGKTVNLVPSHGCIHLKPRDRDTLIGLKAFAPKTLFIVHQYHEKN